MLNAGTAFITDVGMTGDYDSVIGMEKGEPMHRFTRMLPSGRFEPALGRGDVVRRRRRDGRRRTGQKISAVRIGPRLEQPRARLLERKHGAERRGFRYRRHARRNRRRSDRRAQCRASRRGDRPLPCRGGALLLGAGGRALIQRGFARAGRTIAAEKLDACSPTFSATTTPISPNIRFCIPASRRDRQVLAGRLAARRSAPTRSTVPRICCSASSGLRTDSPSSAARTLLASASPTPSR